MELQGIRFGRLVAKSKTTKGKRVAWDCICDCGARVVCAQVDLRSGDTTSCGCRKSEATAARNTTHGMTQTTTYKKWVGMNARVRNTSRIKNKCYIGVSICKRWAKFENFLADMGEPPTGYSLDRVDNTKGYSPTNCRWVPLAEQARNTRRIRRYNGLSISAAARANNIEADVVFDRINKLGWDVDKALTTPTRHFKRSIK
jgi:hypothetical protein